MQVNSNVEVPIIEIVEATTTIIFVLALQYNLQPNYGLSLSAKGEKNQLPLYWIIN